MADIHVDALGEVTPEVVGAFERLILQLSTSSPPVSAAHLGEIVAAPATTLFVARDRSQGDLVVGSLTLVLFRIPTGVRGWIEDVVVDEASRGLGVGDALNGAAIDHARDAGARTVDLTSRPSRAAANRLYQRLGFVERDTNVYRLVLG
jgi:ribosomal protein S18 acetylase RimI-like enzyme